MRLATGPSQLHDPRMSNTVSFILSNPRFLAFGAATAFLSSFGQTFFISLFGGEIRAAFGLSHGDFGAIYAAGTLTSAAILIWAGRKIDDWDLRHYTLVIGFGLAVACAVTAFSEGAVMLVVAVFLLRFFGQGLMSHTSSSSMARYFDRDRGKALSIAGMGYPVAEAVYPIIAVSIMAWLGWRGAWLACAGFMVVATLPVAFWLLKGHAERHREHLEKLDEEERSGKRGRGWTRPQMLRDPRFYLIMPSFLAPSFVFTGLFFHQIHLVDTKGWDLTLFASGYSAYAVAQVATVFAAGLLVDRFSAWAMLRVYLAPLGLGCLVLWQFDASASIFAYMVLIGISSGTVAVTHSAIWAEIYGVAHIGAIKALGTALMVFGSAGGPVFMGWLIDAGVTMETIAFWCAIYTLAAAALVCSIPILSPGAVNRPPSGAS